MKILCEDVNKTYTDVAGELGITKGSVSQHMNRIWSKSDTYGKENAVRFYKNATV